MHMAAKFGTNVGRVAGSGLDNQGVLLLIPVWNRSGGAALHSSLEPIRHQLVRLVEQTHITDIADNTVAAALPAGSEECSAHQIAPLLISKHRKWHVDSMVRNPHPPLPCGHPPNECTCNFAHYTSQQGCQCAGSLEARQPKLHMLCTMCCSHPVQHAASDPHNTIHNLNALASWCNLFDHS
jgi:hypothetical protein